MAKSIRSKRKRKLRAQRREQLKPRVKAQLEKTLGLSDKEMLVDMQKDEENKSEVETFDKEDSMIMNNAAAEQGTEDVVMTTEDGPQKKLTKKALKRINKTNNLKRLGNKKRKNKKILKW